MTNPTPPKESSARPIDYIILSLLAFINVLNFVDRYLLASFANFIVPELHLSNTEYGLLTGFSFLLFYSLMGVFLGALADRVHRPRLMALGIALWSGFTALSGAAHGFIGMLIPRTLIGIGESAATPTAMSMIADRFTARRLGFASGYYYLGVPVGTAGGLLIAGYLGPSIGWRDSFYLLGIVGLVFSGVLLLVPETQRKGLKRNERGEAELLRFRAIFASLWAALKESPALRYTIAGGIAYHLLIGVTAFDQLWFVHERGFERASIAIRSGWLAAGGGVIGILAGGWMSDHWQRRFGSGRPMFLFWTSLVVVPFALLYRFVPVSSPFFWFGMLLQYVQRGLFYGPIFSTLQELVPANIRASTVAVSLMIFNLFGLGTGATGGGLIADLLQRHGDHHPYTDTLVFFTVLSALAIPCMFLAGRRFHSDRERLSGLVAAAA